MDKKEWNKDSHESKVEGFYGKGAENFADYHGGYLNFGLWDVGYDDYDYLTAAENLVIMMGNKLGLNKESTLLDVGFGHGSQDILLYNNFGCKISGIDVTWQHVENARKRVNAIHLTKVRFIHGTATDIPYKDNSFTHLLSIEAPEHFNTREMFLKEAHRVLLPGGKMCLADFILKKEPKTLWERFVVEAARRLWHVPKANWIDASGYDDLLRKIGFRNVMIDCIGEHTIPGYYLETCKKENLRVVRKIRGWFAAYPGHMIDYAVYKAFKDGLIEYVIVSAEK